MKEKKKSNNCFKFLYSELCSEIIQAKHEICQHRLLCKKYNIRYGSRQSEFNNILSPTKVRDVYSESL